MANERWIIRMKLLHVYRSALKEEFLNPEKHWGESKPSDIALEEIKKVYRQTGTDEPDTNRYFLETWFYILLELTKPSKLDGPNFHVFLCKKAHELIAEFMDEKGWD